MTEKSSEAAPVVMTRPDLNNIPVHELPPGFSCRWYQPGDGRLWTQVWQAAEKWLDITDATFRKEFGDDDKNIGKRMFFIMDAAGEPVATSTAWFDDNWRGQSYARVHWVAIIPEKQGCGLAKPLMTITLQRHRELGHKQVVLGTHNVRIPALNLYLGFGFQPEIVNQEQMQIWQALQPKLKYPVTLQM